MENGIHWSEAVDFVNELLEEILRHQDAEPLAEETPASGASDGRGFRPKSQAAEALASDRSVELNEHAYCRWLRPGDRCTLILWRRDPAVSRTLAINTLERIVAVDSRSQTDGAADVCLGVCKKWDDSLIGFVGLIDVDTKTRQAELVKMIGDPLERGKGYARMATRVLLTYGFEQLGLERIYLRTLGTNLNNITLNQSLGFTFEGLLRRAVRVNGAMRDVVLMALLRPDTGDRQSLTPPARHEAHNDVRSEAR
jgi:RimJ/RimL family protein N-acetyltransferase